MIRKLHKSFVKETILIAVFVLLRLCLNVFCEKSSDPTIAIDFVSSHNLARRSVAPLASDMREVMWSIPLQSAAQTAAQQICRENKSFHDLQLGMNVLKHAGSQSVSDIVNGWFVQRNSCSTVNQRCRRYQQVVYYNVSSIGCVHEERCNGNGFITLCLYDQGFRGDKPFVAGPPCSQCPSVAPFCLQGLCVASVSNWEKKWPFTGCRLTCFNCGTLNTSKCACQCQPHSQGHLCRDLIISRDIQNKCQQKCQSLGTPCLNRGKDVSSANSTVCSCQCPKLYFGKYCEIKQEHLLNSVAVDLSYHNGNPLNIFQWSGAVKSLFTQEVDSWMTKQCSESNHTRQVCCKPLLKNFTQSEVEFILTELSLYPEPLEDGYLRVAFYASLKNDPYNLSCLIPQEVLFQGVKSAVQYFTTTNQFIRSKNLVMLPHIYPTGIPSRTTPSAKGSKLKPDSSIWNIFMGLGIQIFHVALQVFQ